MGVERGIRMATEGCSLLIKGWELPFRKTFVLTVVNCFGVYVKGTLTRWGKEPEMGLLFEVTILLCVRSSRWRRSKHLRFYAFRWIYESISSSRLIWYRTGVSHATPPFFLPPSWDTYLNLSKVPGLQLNLFVSHFHVRCLYIVCCHTMWSTFFPRCFYVRT